MIEKYICNIINLGQGIYLLMFFCSKQVTTEIVEKPDFASSILEIKEHDHVLAKFDCFKSNSKWLKWIKVIKK